MTRDIGVVSLRRLTCDAQRALFRRKHTRQDRHQRGLARAIVPGYADAFARQKCKIDIGQRLDLTEGLADAGKSDQRARRAALGRNHRECRLSQLDLLDGEAAASLCRVSRRYFASTILTTSSRLYSLFASAPGAVLASTASSSSGLTSSTGMRMSCGIFLPASSCCVTQKAKVEAPGGIVTDMVW